MSPFKNVLGMLLAALLVVVMAPTALAQATPTLEASVTEAGEQEVTIVGSGWPADLSIFILPCPGVEDEATATGDTCDSASLTPATADADGSFEVTANWDIPAEGLVFAAGDPAQTAGATGTVTVQAAADEDPAAEEEPEDETDEEEAADADLAETGPAETQVLLNVGVVLLFGGYVAHRGSRRFTNR